MGDQKWGHWFMWKHYVIIYRIMHGKNTLYMHYIICLLRKT